LTGELNAVRLVFMGMNPLPKTLIEAVKFFSNPDNCREYLVARRWPDGVTLSGELKARGLADRVRLPGRIEKSELLARLANYDAAILLLKLEEPFGYAWLEAAAAGLPVIVTRGLAVSDVFPSSYPLFVDDRDDAESVAGAVRWCISNRESLGTLGADLRQHLRRQCDTATAVNPRYATILEQAAPPRTRTHPDTLLAAALTVEAYALSVGA